MTSLLLRIISATLFLCCAVVAQAAVTCSVTAGSAAFGVYNPLSAAPLDSTSTVSVTCSLTTPDTVVVNFIVAMSPGTSGSYGSRAMSSGTSNLNYNLYVDSSRSQVWGDGSSSTSTASGSISLGHGLGNNGSGTVTYTDYARLPPAQDVAPGSYTDSIVVSVTW
jgi:spore coat protein U-like protein